MQKIGNIELCLGDVVDFKIENDEKLYTTVMVDALPTDKKIEIIKVVRPVKYETIYEVPKPILTEKEKEYLENVIRPFRNRFRYVEKQNNGDDEFREFIRICLEDDYICFPEFRKGTMYKGMELYKEYTLEELGLFKE